MMNYSVKISDDAQKDLNKIDHYQRRRIIAWLEKNLEGCQKPRDYGKPLRHGLKDFWSYRVGDYRILADIVDDLVLIEVVKVGHRKHSYE
ncbi:MAG: type II toxin-antitoxin system RelE/ParE family toxin [Defluviitaleaceae bacterium]|nr:type II toxin-antitoxin system RelE/ParE family toxin [Defluviitaleaceae bacterium]